LIFTALVAGAAGKSICSTSWDDLLGKEGIITSVQGPEDCSSLMGQLKNMLNDPEQLSTLYTQYKTKYDKDPWRMQKTLFAENVLKIAEHNVQYQKGQTTWFQGVNQFTDMTSDERRSFIGDIQVNVSLSYPESTVELTAGPDSLDWRTKNIVGPVKNQGNCGSCWAFGTVSVIESANAKKTGRFTQFSEQELVDCDKSNGACSGGSFQGALKYIQNNGLAPSSQYGYTGTKDSCKSNGKTRAVRVASYGSPRSGDENAMKDAVATYGPLGTSAVVGDSWYSYEGGVYDGACGNGGHAMSTVGYGTDGQPFWIIKNSWGSDWGEDGYIRLRRGINKCTIASRNVVYATTQ